MESLVIIVTYINVNNNNKGKVINKFINRMIYTELKKFYFTFLLIFYNNIIRNRKYIFKHFFINIVILIKIFVK